MDYSRPDGKCPFSECLGDEKDEEIAALKAGLRKAIEVVEMITNTIIDMSSIHPDGLPAKYLSAYEGILLVCPEAAALLPELEGLVKERL